MAILKSIETPQGVIGTYHKIVNAQISIPNSSIEITWNIYASPEAREAGKNILWQERETIPFSDLTVDPRVGLYELLANRFGSALSGGMGDEGQKPASTEMALTSAAQVAPVAEVVEPEVIVPEVLVTDSAGVLMRVGGSPFSDK